MVAALRLPHLSAPAVCCAVAVAVAAAAALNVLLFWLAPAATAALRRPAPPAGARFSPAQVGCAAAARPYFDRMRARGYTVDVVHGVDAAGAPARSARLRYVPGFRATSRDLATRGELRRKEHARALTFWPHHALALCPYWIEAARLRALLERGMEGGYVEGLQTPEGYGGALARCEKGDRNALLVRTEAHFLQSRTVPQKYCTWETCVQKKRRACREFIQAAPDAELPVFVYSAVHAPSGSTMGNATFLTLANGIRQVANPDDACLFVFDVVRFRRDLIHDAFPGEKFDLTKLPYWKEVDGVAGRNHIVVNPSCLVQCDRSPTVKGIGSLGDALVMSPIFWDSLHRADFDITLPMNWLDSYSDLSLKKRPRDVAKPSPLVFFRGGAAGPSKWDTDRLISAAYSHDPRRGVFIEAAKRGHHKESGVPQCDAFPEEEENSPPYEDMFTKTLFAFCPGGSGPYSFRLTEALAAGAVPIVTEDLTLPLQEVTWYPVAKLWRECAVVVSNSELYIIGDVARDVAALGRNAYEARVESCRKLWVDVLHGGAEKHDRQSYQAAYARMIAQELVHRLRL